MNSGERMNNSTRGQTTTCLFAVSRTTTLECAKVAQYGRSTAESSMTPTTTGAYIGRNPRIMKSTLESENDHTLHSRLYDGMHRFFSSKNIVIMKSRSGHRSVANTEFVVEHVGPLQSTSTLRLLHLSELDFWENTCAGHCSECSKQSLRVLQTHYDECLRRVPVPDLVTGR